MSSASQPDRLDVSVVIPAFNEEAHLARCLESLVRFPYHGSWEVIVVDNNSTDATLQVAQRFSSQIRLQILQEKKQGRGAARATGCTAATGTVLFCLDADTIVRDGWFDAMTKVILTEGNVAATGYGVVEDLRSWENALINIYARFFNEVVGLSGSYWINGFASGFRRAVYEQVGGFDVESDLGEDADLGFRLRKIGHIGFVRRPSIVISGRRYKRGLLMGWWEYFWGFVLKFILQKRTVKLSNER